MASEQLAWEEWKARKLLALVPLGKGQSPRSDRGQICGGLLALPGTVTEVTNLPFATALPSWGISPTNLYIPVLVVAQQYNLLCSI